MIISTMALHLLNIVTKRVNADNPHLVYICPLRFCWQTIFIYPLFLI